MFANLRQRSKNVSTRGVHLPASSDQKEAITIEGGKGKAVESAMLTGTQEPSEDSSPSRIVPRKEAKPIVIDGQGKIRSVAFLVDGKHVLSGEEGKIRCLRIEDGMEGMEVETPMDAGSDIFSIAVSQDGKWVVSGTESGLVTVWNAETYSKVTEFKGHNGVVRAADVSSDGTRIATGSNDKTLCVWSLSTSQCLLGPLKHDFWVVAVKFSRNGLIATASWGRDVGVYDSQNGRRLVEFPIEINSGLNQSLAWASDNKRLFVLSRDGNIHCLDVSTGRTLSTWAIHGSEHARCIALANNGAFIAVSANLSISFWDTTTREQIGSVIEHTHHVWTMAISTNYDLAVGGNKTITLWGLCDILPSRYFDSIQGDVPNERIANITKSVQELRIQLAAPQKADQEESLNEATKSLGAKENRASAEITPLEQTVRELNETITSLRSNLHTQQTNSNEKIAHLEQTNQELRVQLAESQHKVDSLIRTIRAHEQKHQCEPLFAQGRIYDVANCLLGVVNTVNEDMKRDKSIFDWLAEFTHRCITTLERIGDEASNVENHDEAVAAYSTALLLGPSAPNNILIKWASRMLIRGSAQEALSAAAKFKLPRFLVYHVICEILEEDGELAQALECFRQMQNELPEDTGTDDGRTEWELSFRGRCVEKLQKLGDTARDAKKHDEAIEYYSHALSLHPTNPNDILLKRSNELIELDPSSHRGYEGRYVALHGMGRHSEAFEGFRMMLSKLEQSPDPQIRELRDQYVDATIAIQKAVDQTIRHMPRVLIDTVTGRLYDKTQQAAAFEELPIYDDLRSSMTSRLDYARIQREVKKYYRYVMFSHRWEYGEPLFQRVQNMSIYDLESSSPNIKLKILCNLARSLGFQWVWADTCCIDKKDNVVLQESLVAMFTWYRGSSLTIVYLRGVWSHSQQPGDLWRSIWNTRAWTYQEYVAAMTVQFYTEDWKPYLDLDMFNHKESPAIISEMEQASGVSAEELAVLRPGLERVREKLFLASMRHTTFVEDIAYSLLGIFNVAIPVIYGEGNRAVGRLLEHILTGSGDVTILAWTGGAGTYNSCLPMDLTVYNQLVPRHVPQPIETTEMDSMVKTLHSSLPDLSLAMTLHDQLNKLPSPSIAASRLRLAGIVSPVTELVRTSESHADSNLHVYRATSAMFGEVEIKTSDDLSGMEDFHLMHPWISPLLDQDFSRRAAGFDDTTRALRLVARLMQPFGALLLTALSRVQYRRVATDSLIMVRVRETSLNDLIDGICTIDIQ